MTDWQQLYQDDRKQQMAACNELAPEGLLHSLGQPWRALENALRNRNFENKQLLDRVAALENSIVLTKTEAILIVELLEMASDEFGNRDKIDDGFVISSHGVWLPGCYDSERAAKYAFGFSDEDLRKLQDNVNAKEHDIVKRVISFEMLQELARDRKGQ